MDTVCGKCGNYVAPTSKLCPTCGCKLVDPKPGCVTCIVGLVLTPIILGAICSGLMGEPGTAVGAAIGIILWVVNLYFIFAKRSD